MENKTELTKRKIHACEVLDNKNSLLEIIFTTSSNIRKIRKLFPTVQILNECFDDCYEMGECYIRCEISPDYKQITNITYFINCFKYDYKAETRGKDVFNDEELGIIKDEALKVLDKYNKSRTRRK